MDTSIPAINGRRQALVILPRHSADMSKFDRALTALAAGILIKANGKSLDTGRFIAALDHLITAKMLMSHALVNAVVQKEDFAKYFNARALLALETYDEHLTNVLGPDLANFCIHICQEFKTFNECVDEMKFGNMLFYVPFYEQVLSNLLQAHTCFTLSAILGRATQTASKSVVATATESSATSTMAKTDTTLARDERTLVTPDSIVSGVSMPSSTMITSYFESPKKRARAAAQLDLTKMLQVVQGEIKETEEELEELGV
jgi:hypothetical protein